MERLARAPGAFIRPRRQPGAGGVGRRTRGTILLAEAWGRRWCWWRPSGPAMGDDGGGDDRRLRAADRAGRRGRAAGGEARHHGDGRPDLLQQGGRGARGGGDADPCRRCRGAPAAPPALRGPGGLPDRACVSAHRRGRGLGGGRGRRAAARAASGALAARRRAQAEAWFAARAPGGADRPHPRRPGGGGAAPRPGG